MPTTTSPVLRGKWVLENIARRAAPGAAAGSGHGARRPSHRAARRRRCASRWSSTARIPSARPATSMMDPIGFALENFDVVGAWRTHERGRPRRSTPLTCWPTARRSTASTRFAQALVKRPDVFVQTLTEKLLVYALGSRPHAPRTCRPCERSCAMRERQQYRFSALIAGNRRQRAVSECGPDDGGGNATRNSDVGSRRPQHRH